MNKSMEAQAVLQLMDEDFTYQEALSIVAKKFNITNINKLEKELDLYI